MTEEKTESKEIGDIVGLSKQERQRLYENICLSKKQEVK